MKSRRAANICRGMNKCGRYFQSRFVQCVGCFFIILGEIFFISEMQIFKVELPTVEIVFFCLFQHHFDGPLTRLGVGYHFMQKLLIETRVHDQRH